MTPQEICSKHNISITSLKPITHSHSNTVYDVNNKYILRINEEKGFAHEFEMLTYLESKNIPVPKVCFTGDSYIIIEKIFGEILSDTELSEDLYEKVGALYKKLHSLDGDGSVFQEYIKVQMEQIALSPIEDEFKKFISENKPRYDQNVFLHCDPALANILVTPGGDIFLIDFEWSRFGDKYYDLAVFELKHDIKYWDAFRRGYGLQNPLEKSILFYKIIHETNVLRWAEKRSKQDVILMKKNSLKQLFSK